MVMGFLVTCLGITLLQMSKVDPEQLSNLDRKSTILLAASKHTTEGGEKGEVTALEEPGMDALRGGFGAVGSIIRARSLSRRASTMSRSLSRNYGDGMYDSNQNLSTHGLGHLQRYQRESARTPALAGALLMDCQYPIRLSRPMPWIRSRSIPPRARFPLRMRRSHSQYLIPSGQKAISRCVYPVLTLETALTCSSRKPTSSINTVTVVITPCTRFDLTHLQSFHAVCPLSDKAHIPLYGKRARMRMTIMEAQVLTTSDLPSRRPRQTLNTRIYRSLRHTSTHTSSPLYPT